MNRPILPGEKDLLQRLREGDYIAFNQLYDSHAGMIAYKLHKLVKIPEIVEELHQDVFLKVWKHRAELNPDVPFRPFLLHIARNAAVDFFRKAARDRKLAEYLSGHLTALYDQFEELADFNAAKQEVRKAISKLPPQRRRIFIMCKLEGRSYEYAAEYFKVSISTVKDHMAKAMRFLRAEMLEKHPHITILILTAAVLD